MKIKAIRPIWVGDREFLPGMIVSGLEGKALEKALANDEVVEIIKKVKRGNRKNTQ